ncbi:MAG: hypothetical protein QOH16_3881 [Gaiellaceae bacterium]|nr:hypothetical protein [Gaiellaceae bacterium]
MIVMEEAVLDEERERNLAELLRGSHHEDLPIREAYLQTRGTPPFPGPFSEIVRKRHHHALDAHLLMLAAAAEPPHQLHVNPDFWAVLLRRPSQSLRNSRLALYRSIDTLGDLGLLTQESKLGAPRLQLLGENGSGERYLHPTKTGDRYFTLPHEYWTLGLDRKLELPGKAVLLLARSLKRYFTLPLANAMNWYGISSDTLRRGMDELVQARIVRYQKANVPTLKAPRGTTVRRTYTLVGALAQPTTKPA